MLFGGRPAGGGGRPCNTLALFDPDTGAWESPASEGWRPGPREGHSACCTSSAQMVVVGGWDGARWLADMFLLDMQTMTWQHIEGARPSPLPAVSEHVAVFWDYRIIVGGGTGAQGAQGAVYSYDLVAQTWVQEECSLTIDNAIPRLAAAGSSATPLGTRGIVIVGGCSGETWDPPESRRYSRAALLLDPGQGSRVSPVAASGGFPQRAYHVAIPITSHSLLVVGGRDAEGVRCDQWLLTCSSRGGAFAGAVRAESQVGVGPLGEKHHGAEAAVAGVDDDGDFEQIHHSLIPDGPQRQEALRRESVRARQIRASCVELHARASKKKLELSERREQLQRSRPLLETALEGFQQEQAFLRERAEFLLNSSQMHRDELDQLRRADFRGSKQLEEMQEHRRALEASPPKLELSAPATQAGPRQPGSFLDSLIEVAEGEML